MCAVGAVCVLFVPVLRFAVFVCVVCVAVSVVSCSSPHDWLACLRLRPQFCRDTTFRVRDLRPQLLELGCLEGRFGVGGVGLGWLVLALQVLVVLAAGW